MFSSMVAEFQNVPSRPADSGCLAWFASDDLMTFDPQQITIPDSAMMFNYLSMPKGNIKSAYPPREMHQIASRVRLNLSPFPTSNVPKIPSFPILYVGRTNALGVH